MKIHHTSLPCLKILMEIILLTVSIFIIWSYIYNRSTLNSWSMPVIYDGGDPLFCFGIAKAFMDGDIVLINTKLVDHLNAPFSANWNDFFITEEIIFAAIGWLGRLIGLFLSANIVLLLSSVLSGLSFWYTTTRLNVNTVIKIVFSLLFTFTPYAIIRGFGHISLTFYWHIPLMLLVTWEMCRTQITNKQIAFWACVAFVSGLFNPYYTWMFLNFVGFSVLFNIANRRNKNALIAVAIGSITFLSFLIMNYDSITYGMQYGQNQNAVIRALSDLERHGLRLPDLIFPPTHASEAFAIFAKSSYINNILAQGENALSYIGIISILGLVLLTVVTLKNVFRGHLQHESIIAGQTLWVLLYSLTGGINYFLGTFGLVQFRCTNRYSIFICALSLLFFAITLSKKLTPKTIYIIGPLILLFGLWDQILWKYSDDHVNIISKQVINDKIFFSRFENELPQNAMVFMLPVMYFPEHPQINEMHDYEHFLPYIYTNTLRYSYGTNKGRKDEDWQYRIEKLSCKDMIENLELYGFDAIIINKRGYADSGKNLTMEILKNNKSIILENDKFVAIKINPTMITIKPHNTERPF